MKTLVFLAHQLSSLKSLFKKKVAFILAVVCVFSLNLNINACTTFYLRNGTHFVVGRNFDLSYAKYLIFANRRHVTKTAIQYPGQSFSLPAIWTSKYGSITFNMVGSDVPTDGMNEEGLLVSSMILSSSVYPEAESSPSILTEQLLQYFLDNCSTIDEVIDVCSNLEIHPNIYTPWNLHYLVVDNSGNCAAIEFIDGNITATRGDDMEKKVLANSTYSLSMEYFNEGRNPNLPLTASLNRFYTAVEMTDAYAGENIVDYSYSVMDAVEQYFTQRKIVYDIPNMRIYLKTLENTQLRYFDLNTFDFSCQEETEVYSELLSDVGNIRNLFVPLTFELNKTAVQSGWNYMYLTYTEEELNNYSQLAIDYEPVYAYAGENISTCKNFYQISGNTATYYTGNWTVESGQATFDDAADVTTYARNLGVGENRIRWTLSGDLGTFYDEIILTNNKVTATVGEDVSVCENHYILTGSQPGNGEAGLWEVISGSGNIQSASDPNSLISNLQNGTTQLKWTVSNNDCESFDILEITNSSIEAFAGTDEVICGNEVQLEATDPTPNSGSWKILSGSAQIESPNAYVTIVSQLGAGENSFEWKVTGLTNCSATDIVVISNNQVYASAGNDILLCDDSYTLTGNQPGNRETGKWEILSGSGNIQSDITYNSLISNLPKGITQLKWSILNKNCEDADTLTIENNEVDAFAGADKVICGTEIQLDAVDPAPNAGSWKVLNGNSKLDDPKQNNTNVKQLEIGENKFEWKVTGQSGCSATDIIVITNDLVPAEAGEDHSVTNNSTYLSANEPVSGTGTWSIYMGEATFSDINSYNSQALNLKEGINKFIWEIVNNECSDSDTVAVTYSISSSVFPIDNNAQIKVFPNPFSEIITIDMTSIKGYNAQLSIFNSRGQLVYSKLLSTIGNENKIQQVHLSNLPKGNYILTLATKEKITQKTLLKL